MIVLLCVIVGSLSLWGLVSGIHLFLWSLWLLLKNIMNGVYR